MRMATPACFEKRAEIKDVATSNRYRLSVDPKRLSRRDGKPKAAPPDPEKTKPAATAIANGLSEIYRGERFQNVAQAARTGKAGAP